MERKIIYVCVLFASFALVLLSSCSSDALVYSCLLLLIASVFIRHFYLRWNFSKNLITEVIDFPIVFQDDKDVMDISQLKDKFVVLYFFDSECSDKDISKFRKKYDDSRIKDDDRVIIYSIDCYLTQLADRTSVCISYSRD